MDATGADYMARELKEHYIKELCILCSLRNSSTEQVKKHEIRAELLRDILKSIDSDVPDFREGSK